MLYNIFNSCYFEVTSFIGVKIIKRVLLTQLIILCLVFPTHMTTCFYVNEDRIWMLGIIILSLMSVNIVTIHNLWLPTSSIVSKSNVTQCYLNLEYLRPIHTNILQQCTIHYYNYYLLVIVIPTYKHLVVKIEILTFDT